jgi:hypothetical protein
MISGLTAKVLFSVYIKGHHLEKSIKPVLAGSQQMNWPFLVEMA